MDWANMALALIPVLVLSVQGISCTGRFGSPPHVRWFGILAISLALLVFVLDLLLFSGKLVLSPEFASVMVQGSLAGFGLRALVCGFAIAAGIAWRATRSGARWSIHPTWLLIFGLASVTVGLWAAFHVLPLNPDDVERFRIYSYDIWWPLLMIWLIGCFVESILTVLGFRHALGRAWVGMTVIAGLAIWVLQRPWFADPSSKALWRGCVLILLPASTSLATWFGWRLLGEGSPLSRRWMRVSLSVVPGSIVVVSCLGWLQEVSLPPFAMPWFLWLGWLLLIGLLAAIHFYRIWRPSPTNVSMLRMPTLRQTIIFVALIVLALAMSDLVFFSKIEPLAVLIVITIAWVLLAEVIAGGPLTNFYQGVVRREISSAQQPLRHAWNQLSTSLVRAGSRLIDWLRPLASLSPPSVAIFKALLVFALLIALGEIPNSGKMIIQPFTAPAESVPKDVGQLISDHLVNSLGALKTQLRPDVVQILSGRDQAFKLVAASGNISTVDAALARSGDVEITPNVKIPIGALLAPIQIHARRFLGVHVISGTVHGDRRGYALLALSSTGETWRAELLEEQLSQEDMSSILRPNGPIDRLAERLAFKLLSTDPSLAAAMTSSWDAFQSFKGGLQAWERFETEKDYAALSEAIDQFREATRKDPQFALPYYRLGIALQQDGQPAGAIAAFRKSLELNPSFIAGAMALAGTLFDFDAYHYSTAAALPPSAPSNDLVRRARIREAQRSWQTVESLPARIATPRDRAGAYYGLCRVAYENGQNPLAYFYCKRAGVLYKRLSLAQPADVGIRGDLGAVLNYLGVIVEGIDRSSLEKVTKDWHCLIDTIDTIDDQAAKPEDIITKRKLWGSRLAFAYYDRATVLRPDDQVTRCNAATAAYALGDPKPMNALQAEAGAHLSLAESYSERAKKYSFQAGSEAAPPYYRLALKEYGDAIARDPTNMNALNGYAYTFWVWRYNWPDARPPKGPDAIMAHLAEDYARLAKALAARSEDLGTEVMMQSTLGEVLLGQARPNEAIEELSAANARTVHHAAFHEIRWDLAQAYLCASSNEQRNLPEKDVEAMRSMAIPFLREIRRDEERREVRPFTEEPNRLDPSHTPFVCRRDPAYSVEGTPAPGAPSFALRNGRPLYKRYWICGWLGVLGDAYDLSGDPLNEVQPANDRLLLHVWGGGVDRRIPVGEPRYDVFLTSHARNTQNYYFAQLETASGKVVSEAYAVQTFADDATGQCSRNQITLAFDQRH